MNPSITKVLVGVATVVLIGLLSYPFSQIPTLNNRVLSLEKDKEYLSEQIKSEIKSLKRRLDNVEISSRNR